jgi:hypothetical protein
MVVIAPTPVLPISILPVPVPVPMLIFPVLPVITPISIVASVVPPPIESAVVLLSLPSVKVPTVGRRILFPIDVLRFVIDVLRFIIDVLRFVIELLIIVIDDVFDKIDPLIIVMDDVFAKTDALSDALTVELIVLIILFIDVFRSRIDDVFAKTDALSDVIADAVDNVVEKLLKLVTVELKLLTIEPIFVTDAFNDKTGSIKYLFNKYVESSSRSTTSPIMYIIILNIIIIIHNVFSQCFLKY